MSIAIQTEEELEERLSRPSGADVAAMASLDGDLLILGAGGKMGPSLARRARLAAAQAGVSKRIVAVARFSNQDLVGQFQSQGIEAITADLLEPGALSRLPDINNVIFMAARKFGTSGAEYLTWAMNTYLPGLVAERYRNSRIVASQRATCIRFDPQIKAALLNRRPLNRWVNMASRRWGASGCSNMRRASGTRRSRSCD